MTDLSFRTATANDAATIRDFVAGLEEAVGVREVFPVSLDIIRNDMAADEPDFRCELLERDGTPIALVTWYPIYSTWLWRRGIYALDVFVAEHERGNGHARRLLTHLAALARKRGGAFLKLDVDDNNDHAAAAYIKLGFKGSNGGPYLLIGDAFEALADQV
ncbi:MAG: GNAT family N-acetyltransferase [Alphaproteobacteria bacterium]|jgi:GNAT superfamily N-acetyltransferase|nr:GNAT family N-acetyltransferase [Rhodospirillaceae bacterium]MBT6511980.1 GNAT family N-acetyltransferase [Rhodospirillaceae bacterium]MBT7611742.1 GNAT family N-acetyltransferase [Rhodospirillaceae bacterium]MBT7648698.1 GNAT family N-acetyltransferase [Rhodospirillaceae bacterium]MDG2481564.1 GNAT family N-acetyltransferase [Alphaproteobacteria bacterium]